MKKILIIEDDVNTLKLYIKKFTDLGYEVMSTPSGTEGLFYAQKKHPDLVLLDIMLPGKMNGFDVLENLKKDDNLKDIPVVVLTNLDSEKEVALEIGAENYFVKANTNIDDLVKRIGVILK